MGLSPPELSKTPGTNKPLAPAAKYAHKQNVENPELYAVFPFRLIALGKPNLDWVVLVSVVSSEFAADTVRLETLRKDAKRAARLKHPGVLHVFDPGEENGAHYLVTESSSGTSVEQLLRSIGALPQLKALALCQSGVLCRDPRADRMTLVDAHQAAFADHGFCARAESDPEFDRECFSAKGESFDPDIVTAASQPMLCGRSAGEFRAYLPRARWIRDANDSYFAAMTYPQGLPTSQQPT